jgi:two-component system, chemotaxis family, response regulator Rcp1
MRANRKNTACLQILLVDDSPGDVRLTQEAFRDSDLSIYLHIAVDGLDAMAFLKRQGAHAHAPRPDVILLDLSLPKLDGREVLSRIKADDELKAIPTIVLTNSEAEVDIVTTYHLQANCYLAKPVRLDAFQRAVRDIGDFWFTKVILPHTGPVAQASSG